ncbi:unnamed protein product [Bathycoccus prasinos]
MMTSSKKMKEDKRPSQWREILSAGVDGWSSFSDTCSDEPNEKDQGNNITTSKSVLEVQQQQHQQTNHHHQKEKSYPSLDVRWKQERRDIEWQCLWLELRLKELQSHKNRYEKKLKLLDENAAAGGDKERTSKPKSKNRKLAKMVVFNEHPLFDPIRRRREKILKKRKLMTSDEDDKEKDGEDAKMATEVPDEDGKSNKKAKTDDDTSKEHKGNKSGSGGDSDVSNTVMHEKCEDLKKRCLGLMQRLGQPPPIFTSNQGSGGGAKGGKGGGGGSGRGNRNGRNRNRNYPYGGGSGGNAGGAGSGKDGNNDSNKAEAGNNNNNNNNNTRKHMSRKTDEYDINNVVGDIVGAKYVERALHEDINTPSVRVVTTFTMSVEELRRLNNMDAAAPADAKNKDGDDSSDEDISDEAFATRHAKYEVMERNARMPLELLKKAEREKNGGKSPRGRKANKPSSVSKSNSGNEDEKRSATDLNAIHASEPVVLSKKGGDAPRASESNSDSPSDGSAELNEDVVREILRAS